MYASPSFWRNTSRRFRRSWKRLASDLTIGETYFFRDSGVFAALEGEVLPPLIAKRRSEGNPRLRIWSAGCATGEEPYSLAIVLDRLLPDRTGWAVTVLATDIDNAALETARQGLRSTRSRGIWATRR